MKWIITYKVSGYGYNLEHVFHIYENETDALEHFRELQAQVSNVELHTIIETRR